MKPIYKCRICGKYVEDSVHCGKPAVLLLDARRRVSLSKLMSGLLRHYPWEAGLRINRDGWILIDELVKGIKEKWRNKELYQWVTREHIIAVALLDPKGRFEVKDDAIRARYGHSINVNIEYKVDNEVRILYHGTSKDRLLNILVEGIKSMKRKYVHLTIDYEIAVETGKRHGLPAVLVVDAECLRRTGHKVYRASKKIFLTDYVPPKCLSVYRETR